MSANGEPDPLHILAEMGVQNVGHSEPVSGGSDTSIWRVEQGNKTYALRVFRPEQSATYEREQIAMRAAAAAGITVPAIHNAAVVEGRPALLLAWMSGQPLTQQIQSHPLQTWKLGVDFGRSQAAIHAVSLPPDALSSDWIAWAGADEVELQERLHALPPQHRLIHMDYHPLNVMTDGAGITAVLDWANAHSGDPRADFARTYTILRVEPYFPNREPLYISLFRRILERAWRHGYAQIAGKPEAMALFYAWAGATMIRDLLPRIGKPGSWFEERHFEPIRRWTAYWKHQAGLG